MIIDPIFRQSLMTATLLALFSLPTLAATDKAAVNWPSVRGDYAIGDQDLTFTDERVAEDIRINLSLGSEADRWGLQTGSMLNLRDLQIEEGARLTLTLRNEGDDYDMPGRGYWCGSSFVSAADRQGGLYVEVGAGTVFLVGSHAAPEVLDCLNATAHNEVLAENRWGEDGPTPALMIFQETLKLKNNDRFVVGSTLDVARDKNANLLVGEKGVLLIDMGNLHLSGALIEADKGTKIEFEKGSAIIIGTALDNAVSVTEAGTESKAGLEFVSPGSNVVGLDKVIYVNTLTHEEGRFVQNAEGGFTIVSGAWAADGVLAAPVNALYQQVRDGYASVGAKRFFEIYPVSDWAETTMIRQTLLAKSLGTTLAMSDASSEGARFAQKAFLKNPDTIPVNVEILGGRSEGTADDAENGVNRFERDTEGLALSLRGVYNDWLWGARVLYEDANIDVESEFINKKAVDAESTLLSGSFYIGKQLKNTTLIADMTVTGAEDQVDFFQTGHVKIGADEISRQSVSLGMTGLYRPRNELVGWTPTVKLGLQITDYLKSDYSMALDGENLWEVEEKNRLVATADAGIDLERTWHRYTRVAGEKEGDWRTRDDWLTVGLSGGFRARAGDIEMEQIVSAAGASATMKTEDLGHWEAYAGLAFDASWKDALFGASAEGVWGADEQEACRMRVKVVWEF